MRPLSCDCRLGRRYDWLSTRRAWEEERASVVLGIVQSCPKVSLPWGAVNDLALCSVRAIVGVTTAAFPALLVLVHRRVVIEGAVEEVVLPLAAD